ncbi:alpha/beta fold hydrolase [Luteimicrobium subarcticum]|uniref:Pimeloyl-ACP methyl ester carboxylesterase n=1 Tax=Luteimicrobium subarcticum TaxID=620910 RepID=A0A2M8W1F4_9MICO|nr:alpha/beta hydrolase [Luteimicrobium subarcticum]PJI84767.1 pimeloyl-ACP methyl ester carboxylesterase [Luteimicrobium subarcticum]
MSPSETPEVVLHDLRAGDGLPLVLVHGFPLDHRMWDEVARFLPDGLAVVAPDAPGFGDALLTESEPSIEGIADAVAEALAARGVERAVVAGMSMGGYVALALAERHPGLVAALGLVDTKSVADAPEARDNRLRIADEAERTGSVAPVRGMREALLGETSRATRPDLVAEVGAWIEEQRPEAVAWAQRAMASRPDRTAVLAAYGGPVSVVVGVEDELTPIEQAEHLVESSHDASEAALVLVPDAGHLAAVEEPEHVAGALARLHARVTR